MTVERVRVTICGVVQGVGFRPFVFRLASALGLKGWVVNSSSGVVIEAEGARGSLESFLVRLQKEAPAHSRIYSSQHVFLDSVGFTDFTIRESNASDTKTTLVLPDIAACAECLREIFDAEDRRYLYPFTNCTHCGPRYSIIEAIPYDRQNTSMKKFFLCLACRKEYEDPLNRRFHAQPNACPVCGPQVELWDSQGRVLSTGQEALGMVVAAVKDGRIAAVKGIGGFHLWADAISEKSVRLLRERKHREAKPLALMFPSLEMIRECCCVGAQEELLLTSSEAPIVLVARKEDAQGAVRIAPSVAPGNPYLGVMLAYSPLHHILMRQIKRPVVATSGNLSDEPICTDDQEALERLSGIADVFLVHNRPIVRPVDDSVVRVMMNRPVVLRRSRGYAPLPVVLKESSFAGDAAGDSRPSVLAVGGHLKNTVALSVGHNVFISQHVGDLQTSRSLEAFSRTIESLRGLYEPSLDGLACDLHPEYLSTKFAYGLHRPDSLADLPVRGIQHHYAHVLSCMAENHLEGKVLGIAWDGTGFGTDGTIWGGEFLLADEEGFHRAGHLRTFSLPGGERAVQEPRRSALGILFEIFGVGLADFSATLPGISSSSPDEIKIFVRMMTQGINSPRTSSAGRLFDAAAFLCGAVRDIRFEGQAAMALEYLLKDTDIQESYHYRIAAAEKKCLVADWEPMVREMLDDARRAVSSCEISARFHNTLVEMAVEIARQVGQKRVVLSGGCFQNKYLTERMIARLRQDGFDVYWHQGVPPNDGGISLGQAAAVLHSLKKCRTAAGVSRVPFGSGKD